MRLMCKFPLLAVFLVLAFSLVCSINSKAAQIYHGDGATNNGNGGWATGSAASDQCLNCHTGASASDMTAYLGTGHKNVLRKVTPQKPWTFSDGTPLRTSDTPAFGSLYNSGSAFDWLLGQITVGSGPDIPFTPNPYAGQTRDIFYIFGGWVDPGQLDTIWRGGFTGEQFASGNYDCARCHTTGYQFDNNAPEPTFGDLKISSTDFSRVPTDYDPLDPASPHASWQQEGITCERCHSADDGVNNHTASGAIAGGIPTKPLNESGTAICIQCHREESVDTAGNTINPVNLPTVSDGGSCSDGVSPDYPTCIAAGQPWDYAPFFDHESGPTFLNSPHARFSGNLTQNAQNSPDLSVSIQGTYTSDFKDSATGQNNGCMGCHDPHQSTVTSATPLVKNCNDCHTYISQNILNMVRHPQGPGTPFPTGTSADIPGSCAVCHMSQSYHLLRISTDPNYSTFPTAAQLNDPTNPQTTGNTASDGKLGTAVWSDVDLACGQCHVGSGTIGLPNSFSAPVFSKAALAASATSIHLFEAYPITANVTGNGTITPSGVTSVPTGTNQAYAITPATGSRVADVVVDGVSQGAITSYVFPNVKAPHTITASFSAFYIITASAGTGGSISPSGSVTVTAGTYPSFYITPNAGYRLTNVVVDGASVGATNGYVFPNVKAPHTITASFAPIYTITATAGANGTISPSGSVSVTGGTNRYFGITGNTGYQVANVVVDGVSKGALTSYTFTNVAAPHTISASYAPTITGTVGTGGMMTPNGTTLVTSGSQSYTYTITPGSGYHVKDVLVNGVSAGAVASYSFSGVTTPQTIAVTFEKNSGFTITTSTGNQGIGWGSITPAGVTTVASGGSQTYSITPDDGSWIAGVQVDGVWVGAVSSYTFTNVTASHRIYAMFGSDDW